MTARADTSEIDSLRRDVAELRRQFDAVRCIAAALSTAYRTEEVVKQALDVSLELADSDAGSILIYRPAKEKLIFEYVVGDKSAELTGVELDPDEGLAGQVFQAGTTSVSDDVSKEGAHLREIGERVGYKTHNMVTTPLMSGDTKPLGVMQVLNKRGGAYDEFDIALIEIMAAQIALAIENARLHEEARLAAVVRMIGDISHDVKNMVTAPVTGAQTLRDVADDCFARFDGCIAKCVAQGLGSSPEETKEALADLRGLYPEMVEMILDGCEAVQQRMAEISAAVKGIVSKPTFQPADVTAVAKLVETMLRMQAQKKGVALSVEPVGEVPLAVVDSKQISNAIYNLIFNAIDACKKGDSVTFRISAGGDGESAQCGFIVMECADTGPGIPDHVKAKLFTDDAVSTKPMGTGLGTRIVKNVVDAHNGTIEVESEPGAGTSIRCRIPVNRALYEAYATPSGRSASHAPPTTGKCNMKRIVAPTFLSLDRPLAEVLSQVAEAGVHLIELHGDAPDRHIDLTDSEAVRAAARAAAELGLEVHSVHSPFSNPSEEDWDISQPDDSKRARAIENHAKVIRAAAKLGASHVVIHAGVRDRTGFRAAHCRESLEELTDVARETGIKIAVENLPPDYLVSSVASVQRMIDGLDPSVVGFCLDTGHAMLGDDSPTDYVRAFQDRLLGVHWHYNDGKDDAHLFPNHADSDWRDFLAALAEIGYDLPVTVEAVPPDGVPLRDAFQAAREAFRQENGSERAA